MIGYPFNSHVTYDEHDVPIFDRAISSVPLKNLIAKLFSNGVLPNPSTNLQVVTGSEGMSVIVHAGFCIINGGLKLEDEDKTLVVQASDSTHPRIDTVVMRWNDNDEVRACDLYVVEGTPSANPVRPNLTRTESIYELGLADIYITAGSTSIDSFRITDTRLDTNRCGYISSISEFDTSTLYAQIQSDLDNFQENEQADFLAWFEEMRDQLSEDAAGNLQNEIDEVNGRFNGLTEDVQRWEVRNVLPEIGREGTVYLLTGEQEAHYNGDVDDDNESVINDDMISTGTTFSSNKITNLLNSKVNAEQGKGLSTNDFTTENVAKLNAAITQIKTINGQSLVGTGNIEIQGGSGGNGDVTTSLLINTLYARNRKHDFAWGELPHAMIALVVDDCKEDIISGCVTNAAAKQIPLNMAIIVDYFDRQATNETVLQAIKRGINNGGEALMHGNGIITPSNIDDESYLKNCFLTKKEVAIQNGINPRGFIVMGGGDEVYGDPRTDRWVRALYDYSDGYGITNIEPYYHRRLGCTSLVEAKSYIDDAVLRKKFIVIFAHKWWDWWGDMIDYAKAQGAEFVTYAYVYDKYGTTKAEKASETRIKALEDRVFARVLVSISASKVTTTYYEGDELNTGDISVAAVFDNGSVQDVTAFAEIDTTGVDMSTAGTYTIPVSYSENGITETASLTITVEEIPAGQELASISASKTVTQYVEGALLDISDITVIASYTNSSTADVSNKASYDTSNVDMAHAGLYTIPISYTEGGITKTASVNITVVEDQGTVIYSKSSLTLSVTNADIKTGTKINVTSGKKYVYDFDVEVTSGGYIDVRAEALGHQFSPALLGEKSTGWTTHITNTITSTLTRQREPFGAKYVSSAYTVKLTNITIREKN